MALDIRDTEIAWIDDEEIELARLEFEPAGNNVINITRTFVDPILRGKGVAGQLMDAVVLMARDKNLRIIPTCSYAASWFEKHEDQADLLA